MTEVEQCLCRACEVIEGKFGFFEPREILRSFVARGMHFFKLV